MQLLAPDAPLARAGSVGHIGRGSAGDSAREISRDGARGSRASSRSAGGRFSRSASSSTRSQRGLAAERTALDDPFPQSAVPSSAPIAATSAVPSAVPTSTSCDAASSPAASPLSSRERASADFDQLVSMGYEAASVAAALADNGGSRERALYALLAAGDDAGENTYI